MTSSVSFSGLGSGLDTSSIVSALVRAQRAPLDRLNSQVSAVTAQKNTLANLASQVATLASKADALKLASNLSSSTATSSDAAVVSVVTGGGARSGSFDVSVQQLAAAHRSYSNAVSARDQAGLFGTGTISLQIGSGQSVSIDVTSSMTLDDVASAIDNTSGFDASVVFDGSQYRLQIAGTQTGAANAVTLSESGTTLGLTEAANLKQAAVDAQFTVDGIPMTRGKNLVDDALPGVSLSLNKVSTTPATVRVTADSTALKGKLQAMVDAYNTVVNTIRSQSAVVGANNGNKLSNDSTLAGLQRSLAGMISTRVGTGRFQTFTELGLATQKDGTLLLDAAKLDAALTNNRDAVVSLVADDPRTGYVGLGAKLGEIAHGYGDAAGVLQSRVRAMGDRLRGMTTQAAQLQTRIDAYEAQLTTRFAAMENQVNGWKATSSSISNAFKRSSE